MMMMIMIIIINSTEQSPSLRSEQFLNYSRNSPHFMEPEGSLPHSQQPATCPYPEPVQPSPSLSIPSLEDPILYYPSIYA
jgi:hypothetical protein